MNSGGSYIVRITPESIQHAQKAGFSATSDYSEIAAMDAIITVDEAQKIVLFNRTAEKLFGCSRGEALGTPLERFIPNQGTAWAFSRHELEHFFARVLARSPGTPVPATTSPGRRHCPTQMSPPS